MRLLGLIAAAFLVAIPASAAAEQWTDPAGRLIFDAPRGWRVTPQNNNAATVVITFDGSHDCYLFSTPNAGTSSATPSRVRTAGATALSAQNWVTLANGVSSLFPGGNAQLNSQTVDESGTWPIQRAEFSGGEAPVYAALQLRPGFDISAFCIAYGGDTAAFESLFRSIGHPNDAAWRAAVEADAAPAQ